MLEYDSRYWNVHFISKSIICTALKIETNEIDWLVDAGIVNPATKSNMRGDRIYSMQDVINILRYRRLRKEFRFTASAAITVLRALKVRPPL